MTHTRISNRVLAVLLAGILVFVVVSLIVYQYLTMTIGATPVAVIPRGKVDTSNIDEKGRHISKTDRKGRHIDWKGHLTNNIELKRHDTSNTRPTGRHTSNTDGKGRHTSNVEWKGRYSSNTEQKGSHTSNTERKGRHTSNIKRKGRHANNTKRKGRQTSNSKWKDHRNFLVKTAEGTRYPNVKKSSRSGDILAWNTTLVILDVKILTKIQSGAPMTEILDLITHIDVFGVFSSQLSRISVTNHHSTRKINGYLPSDVSPDPTSNHIVCLVYTFNSRNVTLVVMHQTPNFVFVPSCHSQRRNFSRVAPGKTPMLFDRFRLERLQTDGRLMTRLALPTPIKDFLLEFPASQFVDCNRNLAARFKGKNVPPHTIAPVLKDYLYIKYLLKSLGILAMLQGGCLLGWYRQCGVIKTTFKNYDMDFSIFERDLSLQLHEVLRGDNRIRGGLTYNTPEKGFQYTLYLPSISIDILVMMDMDRADRVYVGEWSPPRDLIKLIYPRSEMCSAILEGHRFNVPCRVESLLVAEYGPEWPIPVSDWKWNTSPHNLHNAGPWSDQEWPAAHGQLREDNRALLKLFTNLKRPRR